MICLRNLQAAVKAIHICYHEGSVSHLGSHRQLEELHVSGFAVGQTGDDGCPLVHNVPLEQWQRTE